MAPGEDLEPLNHYEKGTEVVGVEGEVPAMKKGARGRTAGERLAVEGRDGIRGGNRWVR